MRLAILSEASLVVNYVQLRTNCSFHELLFHSSAVSEFCVVIFVHSVLVDPVNIPHSLNSLSIFRQEVPNK